MRGKTAQSHPLSHEDAHGLVRDPERLSRGVLRGELVGAVKTGGLVGGGLALVVSGVTEARAVARGDRDAGEAAARVALATGGGAIRGAVTAGAGTAIRHGLLRAGAKGLARGAGPLAIASIGVEVGVGVARFAAGDIDGPALGLRCARAATSGGGAWAGAAIGSALCPGIGTLVGGLIGGVLGGLLF